MDRIDQIMTTAYADLSHRVKPLRVYLYGHKDTEKQTLTWEFTSIHAFKDKEKNIKKHIPGGLSEYEYFEKYKDQINEADEIFLQIAEYCDKHDITYELRVCKVNKLQKTDQDPPLLTSYIAVNFPKYEQYESKVHEYIPKTKEEFERRKELGLK